MASQKVEICLKKKNPPRAQIFCYFRIESRNIKIPAYALIARNISRVNCPKLVKMAKMAIFKPS